VLAYLLDITDYKKSEEEKKRLETQLQHAQRMESIGILANGLAHDFNNLLTGILGYTNLSKDFAELGSELHEFLSEAEKACISAKDLTKQFIIFSKGEAPVKKARSLVKLIEDTTTLTLSGSNVECEFSLSDDLWQVEFDKEQMKHVIAILITNAKEAMSEGGKIKVSAQNITFETENDGPWKLIKKGNYVKISIQDRGIGIPEENLPKLFDPYFSTKERGAQKGMGLGLSIAYSIVEKHGGYINIESEMGNGTNVYVYLPTSERETLKEKSIKGELKILVMDDEEMIRDVAGKMLSRIGCKVGFAKEGAEAIELYRKAKESAEPFDAVILDLTIRGGMGGKEAIQKLLEMDPEVNGIVSSGYSSDPVLADFRKYGFTGAVTKPYNIEDLSKTLREVVSGEQKTS